MKRILRRSIRKFAEYIQENPRGAYISRNKGPQVKEVERVLSQAQLDSDKREKKMVEELYAKYGGNPEDLPWAKT